jgi:membrane-associated protease RseP (regulator of RpoE activity)
MAVAGPLAGFVIAVPALFFGLKTSQIMPVTPDVSELMPAGTSVGSSLLLVLIRSSRSEGIWTQVSVLRLSPLAFAGWPGLFVTALNLLPIGQLDGGHIARVMFGHRIGNLISSIAVWALVLLATFVWPGLMLWAFIVPLIARRGTPPLNDLTPVTRGRLALGYVTFAILVMILVPLPESMWRAAAARCPSL